LTGTAGSSAQFYYEGAEAVRQAANGATPPPVGVPVGVAVFPHDIFVPVRRFADRDIPTIARWTEFDRGGHFAALEQPELLVDDIRSFFHSLR
jgi:pimeloyl-ACP methyl ester carboxylesterase